MSTTHSGPELPELTDAAVERIEAGVFESIADERTRSRRRSSRRRRWIGGTLSAAAVVVAAIAVVPLAMEDRQLDAASSGGAVSEDSPYGDVELESGPAEGEIAPAPGAAPDDEAVAAREIIRTATATLVVDDMQVSADALAQLAVDHDGYVSSMTLPGGDAAEHRTGRVTLRVPAGDLDGMRASLADLGDVTDTSVDQEDVTATAVDLRARVESARTSVERLTQLMSEAGSVGDLLEAEQALAERQAELESYESQLEQLEGQVAMSTITITLVHSENAQPADPAGFVDGLLAGWNGFVAFLGGLVLVAGFLVPWAAGILVVALVVWGIVRLVRRRRGSAPRE